MRLVRNVWGSEGEFPLHVSIAIRFPSCHGMVGFPLPALDFQVRSPVSPIPLW